jgi:hypothetical protein
MIGKVTKDGLNKSTAALGDPNSSIIRAGINIAMMLSGASGNITEVDTKGRTGIIFKNLTEASKITNGVTMTDSMLRNWKDMLTAGKRPLKISNNTHRLSHAAHQEEDLTKGVTIAAPKCSEITTNFMMATIKKMRDLILKKLEARGSKLLTNNHLVMLKNEL